MPNIDREEFLALDLDALASEDENGANTKRILGIKAFQYDIVCNGVELSSGAIRNHRPDVMEKPSPSPATATRCWSRSSAAC